MNTTKKGVQIIAETCRRNGIRKVVLSPGSRSAPLVIAFSQMKDIECLVIPDERVAGYFALGMAQQLREPVALVCTSGTAALNLIPAACEAFYQNVPLLILTADRPKGLHLMGENQAIKQDKMLAGFNRFEENVDGDADSKKELKEICATVSEAIELCNYPVAGPSHINVHINEPLYETGNDVVSYPEVKENKRKEISLSGKDLKKIRRTWNSFAKKMIVVGMHPRDRAFAVLIKKLSQRQDVVILQETLSNLNSKNTVWNYEVCIPLMDAKNAKQFVPELVITLGNQIISKRLRQFLKNKPVVHWDVPPGSSPERKWKIFGNMYEGFKQNNEAEFLNALLRTKENTKGTFKDNWLNLSLEAEQVSEQYLSDTDFSDLKVFEVLVNSFPKNADIQYGNSSPIRYAQFFAHPSSLSIHANRGTSGVDGCVSTAAGAALANKQITICVVGDVSFLYDSNALWNNYLSPYLRIIVINNGGGNIFRLIEGPTKLDNFSRYFETAHGLTAEHIAAMHQIPYYYCSDLDGLNNQLREFYKPHNGKPAILEIKTDGVKSAEIYKDYFNSFGVK